MQKRESNIDTLPPIGNYSAEIISAGIGPTHNPFPIEHILGPPYVKIVYKTFPSGKWKVFQAFVPSNEVGLARWKKLCKQLRLRPRKEFDESYLKRLVGRRVGITIQHEKHPSSTPEKQVLRAFVRDTFEIKDGR